jgi:GNAT superfamily N-acetyltransferase
MGRELAIRRYEPADADRVWTVHERALRASPLTFVEDAAADEDIAAISERYLDAGGEFLVRLVDGEIVATGGFRPRGEATVEIRRMRVDPDHQRRGYGARILEALEARAQARGFERAVPETNERLAAARELYEGRGYEEAGGETDASSDGETFVRYQKKL